MTNPVKRGTFPAGQSGNYAGRPPGTGDAARLRAAIGDRIDAVVDVVVAKALAGDVSAAGLLMARVLPPLRPVDDAVPVKLGRGTVTEQARRVVALMASGKAPMGQGVDLITSLASIARMKTLDELTDSVEKMETELELIRHEISANKNT